VIVLTNALDKSKKQLAETAKKTAEQERVIVELNKELAQAKRAHKKTEQDSNAREVRLNRLIEEVERYKTQLREVKSTEGETQDRSKKEFERLQQENKRLERQKGELFTAFKKQLKLIDILKRQKLHIEAARMLQFSEEEFMRTLDLGERL
jgi:chromosome segregation ATPase